MTEELWEINGYEGKLHNQKWAQFDEEKCKENTIEVAVQVNGKLKSRITIDAESSNEDAINAAKNDEKVAGEIAGKTVVKEIYVKGKIVNIVVK